MDWLWFILAGLAGGILGGMGMGGGTVLIPILTLFLGLGQHLAQGVNLLVFIPAGLIALIIHAKNKLLDFKAFFIIVLPALAAAVLSSMLAAQIEQNSLTFYFGIFLVLVGVYAFVSVVVKALRAKRERQKKTDYKAKHTG